MLRRKASGLVATLFATAAITGTVFAADLEGSGIETTVSGTEASVRADVGGVEEEADAVTEAASQEDGARIVETGTVTEGVLDEKIVDEAAGEITPAEPSGMKEEGDVLAGVTGESAKGDVIAGTENPVIEEAEGEIPAVNEEAQPAAPAGEAEAGVALAEGTAAEAAVLVINHHFVYEDIVCDDYETLEGMTAGESVNAGDYTYCDTFEFVVCTNPDESMELASGENQMTIEYTLAEGYTIVD